MKKSYEKTGKKLGYEVRVFSKRVPNLARRLEGFNRIVIFTGTVAHPMVTDAVRIAKKKAIPLGRSHSSSVSALNRFLNSPSWA